MLLNWILSNLVKDEEFKTKESIYICFRLRKYEKSNHNE